MLTLWTQLILVKHMIKDINLNLRPLAFLYFCSHDGSFIFLSCYQKYQKETGLWSKAFHKYEFIPVNGPPTITTVASATSSTLVTSVNAQVKATPAVQLPTSTTNASASRPVMRVSPLSSVAQSSAPQNPSGTWNMCLGKSVED